MIEMEIIVNGVLYRTAKVTNAKETYFGLDRWNPSGDYDGFGFSTESDLKNAMSLLSDSWHKVTQKPAKEIADKILLSGRYEDYICECTRRDCIQRTW